MSVNDAIAESLGVEGDLMTMDTESPDHVMIHQQDTSNEFADAKLNIKHLIEIGINSIEPLSQLATESESIHAYKVLSESLKTLADMNKSIVDMAQSEQSNLDSNPDVTNNNYLFVGSTEELQQMIKDNK